MDQREYDKKYKQFPWWSNALLTMVMAYPFLLVFFGVQSLFYWWVHVGVFILGIVGIWLWDPITDWFKRSVEALFDIFR